jgi:hypothetical protein
MNGRCAFAVQFIVIRMKIETAQPAVQCCADVHFFFVIRTGVSPSDVCLSPGQAILNSKKMIILKYYGLLSKPF